MANQLQKGTVFVDGQVVNAALLNSLVDLAIALEGIISTHAPVAPAGTDYVLLLRPGTPNTLQKGVVSNLPSGVTTLNFNANPASVFGVTNPNPGGPVTTITLSLDNQGPNKFLAGPVSGAAVAPLFRAIAPADTASFTDIAALAIDCTQDNVFRKILPNSGVQNLKINNGTQGQRVSVYLIQSHTGGTATVNWDTNDSGGVIRWPGGVNHTMTQGIDRTDIVNFLCMGSGLYYGTYDKDFTP